MKIRRLGWAGIELDAGGERLVVDHMLDPGIFAAFFGKDRDELITTEQGTSRAALVTHLHRDHADERPALHAACGDAARWQQSDLRAFAKDVIEQGVGVDGQSRRIRDSERR